MIYLRRVFQLSTTDVCIRFRSHFGTALILCGSSVGQCFRLVVYMCLCVGTSRLRSGASVCAQFCIRCLFVSYLLALSPVSSDGVHRSLSYQFVVAFSHLI